MILQFELSLKWFPELKRKLGPYAYNISEQVLKRLASLNLLTRKPRSTTCWCPSCCPLWKIGNVAPVAWGKQPYTLKSPTPPDPDLTTSVWDPHLMPRVVWLSSHQRHSVGAGTVVAAASCELGREGTVQTFVSTQQTPVTRQNLMWPC